MTTGTQAVIRRILDGSLAPFDEPTLVYVKFLAQVDIGQAHKIVSDLIELGYCERIRWNSPVTVCAVPATDLAGLVEFCIRIELMAVSALIRCPQALPEFPDTAANLTDALIVMLDYHGGLVDLAGEKLGTAFRIFGTRLQLCLAQLRRCLAPEYVGRYTDLVREAILAGNEEAAARYLGVFYAHVTQLGDPFLGSLDPTDVIDETLEATAAEDAYHGCTGK